MIPKAAPTANITAIRGIITIIMVMAITTIITAMAIITTITEKRAGAAQQALYRLLTWLSPAYPVGAYTYSHGLEAAVEAGSVAKRDGLIAYVSSALQRGAGRVDGALLVAAHRAMLKGDDKALDEVAELVLHHPPVVVALVQRRVAPDEADPTAQGAAQPSLSHRALAGHVHVRLALVQRRDPVRVLLVRHRYRVAEGRLGGDEPHVGRVTVVGEAEVDEVAGARETLGAIRDRLAGVVHFGEVKAHACSLVRGVR